MDLEDMDESVKKFNWIVAVPIGLIICAIGITGNVLSIIVWKGIQRKQRHGGSSAPMYLITLAVCDIGFLVFYVLADALPKAAVGLKSNHAYAVFYSWIAYPSINFFFIAGVWLVVGVTINRFILTYYPLKGKEFCSTARTRIGIAFILVLAVCVNIPHFLNYHPKRVDRGYMLKKTYYGDSFHSRMFHFWLHCIILSICPWFLIAAINLMIIHKLKKQTLKFTSIRSRARSENQDRKMTNMLLAITFTFLVLMGFQCVTQCLHKQQYRMEDPVFWAKVQKAYTLGRLALAINSSINCFFYCFSAVIFRAEAKRMWRTRTFTRSSTFTSDTNMSMMSDKGSTFRKIASIVKGGTLQKGMNKGDSVIGIIPDVDTDQVMQIESSVSANSVL